MCLYGSLARNISMCVVYTSKNCRARCSGTSAQLFVYSNQFFLLFGVVPADFPTLAPRAAPHCADRLGPIYTLDMFIISEGQIIRSNTTHIDTIVRVLAMRECVYPEFMEMLHKQNTNG